MNTKKRNYKKKLAKLRNIPLYFLFFSLKVFIKRQCIKDKTHMVIRYRSGLRHAEWHSCNLLESIPVEFVIISLQNINEIYDTMN